MPQAKPRWKRRSVLAACVSAALVPASLLAQAKVARIGLLGTGAVRATPQVLDGLKQGLRAQGWIEGRNVEFIILSADGHVDRLDGLARQLVDAKVDVIVTGPPTSAVAAHRATRSIPIVMANVPDPVALGLVQSLARPGGNVTGVSSQTTALVAKELELLKQVVPAAKRIGLLINEKNPSAAAFRAVGMEAAASLQLTLVVSVANQPGDLPAAVQRLQREAVQAVAVPADPTMLAARGVLNELLAKARLPAAFGNRDHALDGALLSYSPDIVENFRVAGRFVDRILRGADPARLPVEQSDRIELVVNLKTARALGIAIPQSVLLRADQIVE